MYIEDYNRISKINIYWVLYTLAFLLSAFPALFLTAPLVEDAIGTMGAAAYLAGHDWGAFLVSKGFYYKYGQSLFYLPIFSLIDNPAIRYKFLLIINSFITAIIPVAIYKLGIKHLYMSEDDATFISLIVGCMPATLLYSKLTWAEPVLFTLPWLIIYVVLELVDISESPVKVESHCKKRRHLSALLAWLSVFAFMSHQRGIVVVLAVCLMLIIVRVKNIILLVNPWIFISNLIAGLVLDRICDVLTKKYVYLGADLKHNLLSSFLRPEIYQKLFSLQGIKSITTTFLGWLFNSSVSGLGITLFGIIICISLEFGLKEHSSKFSLIVMLGSLLYVGSLLLGMLFFAETNYDYLTGTVIERCDHLVFGRYLESSLPIMMFIGLYTLSTISTNKVTEGSSSSIKTAPLGAVSVVIMIFITIFYGNVIAPAMQGVDCYVHSLMSMNICFDMSSVTKTQDIISNLPQAIAAFGIFACVAYPVCLILAAKGKRRVVYIFIGCTFFYIYMRSFWDILYRVDSYSLTDYARFYLTH